MIAAASTGTDPTLLIILAAIAAVSVVLSGVVAAGAAILSATRTSKQQAANLQAQLHGEREARKLEDERQLRDVKRVRLARLYEAAIRAAIGVYGVAQRSMYELEGEDPAAQAQWRKDVRQKAQEQFDLANVPVQMEADAKAFSEQFSSFNKALIAYYVAMSGRPRAPGPTLAEAEAALEKMKELAVSDLSKLERPI